MINLETIQALRAKNNGFFRFKKFDEATYLVTNDIGRYCFLTSEEFQLFVVGDISSGEKYDELCEKGFIKTEGYERKMIEGYAEKNSFLGYGPTLHIIVTTLRCNHACKYCHASVVGETDVSYDMTLDTAKKVVDTIFYTSSQSLTIEFQGGESLLNFEVVKFIVEYAKIKAGHLRKGLSLSLVTNATLLDAEKLQYFVSEEVSISTSFDGDEALHNHNRTYKAGNSYQEVVQKIQEVNDCYAKFGKPVKIGALLTVTRETFPKYKQVIDAYLGAGLDGMYIRLLNPYGFAEKKLESIGYSHEEFLDYYKKSMDYIIELNKKGMLFKEHYTTIFLRKILTRKDPNFLDSRSPCGACIGQVAYNYDGKIFSCDEGRMFSQMGDDSFQIGEVGDDASGVYVGMIENDVTKVMVQASTLDGLPGYNDHVYKPYLGVCPVSSYKASGNVFSNFSKDGRTQVDVGILDYIFDALRDKETREIFETWIGVKTVLDGGSPC